MASAEMNRPRPGDGGDGEQSVDVPLTWEDREELLNSVARIFPTEPSASQLLASVGFPPQFVPAWVGLDAAGWWQQIFVQFDNGVIGQPYRRLINAVQRRYQANGVFTRLVRQYLTPQPDPPAPTAVGATCHIIVRASTEEEREAALAALRGLGLQPSEVWATQHAVSYAVASTDAAAVRRNLADTDLGWTVVPAGQPDYLYRELFVQGPDGSLFRLVDAPSQQTFRNVAEEVVSQYDSSEISDTTRPTVIDRVGADGAPERANPEDTLHDAGVQDGDSLRVGFQGTAGAVNPLDREDALDRVRKAILDHVQAHPNVQVRANSITLPTEYEIDFEQESFGPPPVEGGEPTRIRRHTIRILLGAEFPETAPTVFWITPVFHPNVFPTYDCEALRQDPNMHGVVCLGLLAESWHPAMDFGHVLQTLVDIAGYRNYDVFQPTGEVDMSGTLLRANFADRSAAVWALSHQRDIAEIGGTLIMARPRPEVHYPNVVQRVSADVTQ
jgi:hypothetical protein